MSLDGFIQGLDLLYARDGRSQERGTETYVIMASLYKQRSLALHLLRIHFIGSLLCTQYYYSWVSLMLHSTFPVSKLLVVHEAVRLLRG